MCLALIIVMDARLAESEEMLVLPQKMCLLKTISGGLDRRKRTSTASPFTVQLMAFTSKFLFLYMSAFWVCFIESASIIPHLGVAKVQVSFCPWKAAAATNTCVHVDTVVQTFESLWPKRPRGIYMVWELMKLTKRGSEFNQHVPNWLQRTRNQYQTGRTPLYGLSVCICPVFYTLAYVNVQTLLYFVFAFLLLF